MPWYDRLRDKLFAVRDEKWRLVEGQLFDLEADPGEETDVAAIALNAWFWSWMGFRRNLKAVEEIREEYV